MFFNLYAVYQTMKHLQEETEKNSRNACKFEDYQIETFIPK
jgi:hypothetical protein